MSGGPYPRSGNTDEALTTPAVDVRELLGGQGGITPNRTFYMRYIWVYNSHATQNAVVQVYNQAEGVAVAANERFSFVAPPTALTIVDVPEPGIAFSTEVCAAVTNGTIAIYQAGCGGYEVGGMPA